MQKIVRHPELGDIIVLQTARARRVSLRVLSSGSVRLTVPVRASVSDALKFLDSKKDWVLKALSKVEARRKPPISMPFSTRTRSLYLDPKDTEKFFIKIEASRIVVSYPLSLHYESEQVQSVIKRALEEVWRLEAKAMLPSRVMTLAGQNGFKVGKVSIRNTKTRWGSCSAKDDISLSLHLMSLPDHLIDYILLHELCHTVHKNHGEGFYGLLDKVSGGKHKQLNRELKAFHIR